METQTYNPQSEQGLNSLESMRNRLLDLTGRNRLINFKHTKKTSLRIIDEMPNQLVETLLAEKEMSFLPIKEPTREELIETGYIEIDEEGFETRVKKEPTAEEWGKYLGFSTSYEVPEPEPDANNDSKHTDTAIQTLFFPYELESRLKTLLQTSESAIQEMGANILYMAFGFLKWNEQRTENDKFAPLFLVPVRLHKGRLNQQTKTYEYTLTYSGEDIIPNLSLREKLRLDFSIELPDLDENTKPESYFNEVKELIDLNQPSWDLKRYISLTLLNFSKLLMYLDLDINRWPKDKSIIDHEVVSNFLMGLGDKPDEGQFQTGFGEEYPIDDFPDIHYQYPLIDDADSSQHSAIIDAIKGKNLVIEGPPGTGKSQTITNLIAASLAQGKKVLFVAEKLAALEVVRSRLDKAGLGLFCLELHSHKSQKTKVMEDLKERINALGTFDKNNTLSVEIEHYENLKNQLTDYAIKINSLWKNTNQTIHDIFMKATRYRLQIPINPESLHPDGYNGDNYDLSKQRQCEDSIVHYQTIYQSVINQLKQGEGLYDHPWHGVQNTNLQIFDRDKVTSALSQWQSSLNDLLKNSAEVFEQVNVPFDGAEIKFNELTSILYELYKIPDLQGNELLNSLPVLRDDAITTVAEYIHLFEKIQWQFNTLERQVSSSLLSDLSALDKISKAKEKLGQYVSADISIKQINFALQRIEALEKQMRQYQKPISDIQQSLGDFSKEFLNLSDHGINELSIFIRLTCSLKPHLWRLRDPLFDNDELDVLLPELRAQIEPVLELHNELDPVLMIDNLPVESELLNLKKALADGGLFKWFKSSWRSARKKVIALLINSSDVKSSEGLLAQAIKYQHLKTAVLEDKKYSQALAGYFESIHTDLEPLENLRAWYKAIRKFYGIGFGSKVQLGESLIMMSENIAKGIRSLYEQGIDKQLHQFLLELKEWKEIFSPAEKSQEEQSSTIKNLHSQNVPLIGDEEVLCEINNNISHILSDLDPVIKDENKLINTVNQNIDDLNELKAWIASWTDMDCDNQYFNGQLNLSYGVSKENEKLLLSVKNTLSFAKVINDDIADENIKNFIYEQPTNASVALLYKVRVELNDALTKAEKGLKEFSEITDLDYQKWRINTDDKIEKLNQKNAAALTQPEYLQNWLEYIRIVIEFEKLGLSKVVSAIESHQIDISNINDAFNAGIFDLLSREIIRDDSSLSLFSGRTQESIQLQFQQYDNRLKKLQCEQIAWRIDQNKIPKGSASVRVSDKTDYALIEYECAKKKRHTPLRQLIRRAGNALVELKPCFMMGPMSVAQYLAPGEINFDLIVMDEASQIKPQDALGAIARGSQLIVVGDPKQLPPTSFFDRSLEEDEDGDHAAIEESESILDATLPIFKARRLRWHYRSQHEDLISFSNQSFYDNDLVLFPSPHNDSDDFGIKYYRIKRGCFVNRRNIEESKIISEAVKEHFFHRPDESIGIAAMSAEQRLQIERAIESLAKEDNAFQSLLEKDAKKQESLFIKNLENVQGDERDVIFISMTYGPQEPEGKVYQRFGPINSEVGWRRLNVLFTRSKKRMHIFSSMGSNDIVVGSSAKRGVRALKNFLAFCETGVIHQAIHTTDRQPDSDFEIAVMDLLSEYGYECHAQVGVSGFFIDIAVVDPGKPGKYLMGIECDGATYHSAKSARDRDRLRQTILERLGWNIQRIWSTDWFKNPEAEINPIIKQLERLKTITPSIVVEPEIEIESETEEINEIVEAIEHEAEITEQYILEEGASLKDKLIHFDKTVISQDHPETPENQRLLRPAMLEALLEYKPTSRWEFLEYIPAYLRKTTCADQGGKYLEQIFEIINADQDK